MIYVVSTGLNAPTKQKCIESVRDQDKTPEGVTHLYVEAGEQSPVLSACENFANVVRALPPGAIVVWLDGDDWLARPDAIKIVEQMHRSGAWVTYGSMCYSDGRPAASTKYMTTDYRRDAFRAAHLRSFRAGLFQRIRPADLELDGQPIDLAWDVAVMLPMLEMAGVGRQRWCKEILCCYNLGSSFEWNADVDALERERKNVKRIRQKDRYAELPASLDAP